jgi:hypothetical protein
MRRFKITERAHRRAFLLVRTKLRQAREGPEQKDDEKIAEVALTSKEAVTLTAEDLPDETPEAWPNKKKADLLKFGWARMLPMRVAPASYDKRTLVLQAREGGTWKEIVPEEKVQDYMRREILDPKSKMPLSRDSAYHAIQKNTLGISRRKLMGFLQKQAALQVTRNVPTERKLPGRPVEGKGYLELDLIEAKGRDISKFVHHYLRNFFWIMLVDRLTGWIEVERTTEKHAHIVSPLLKKMLKRMAEALKTDIKHIRSDRGGEFKAETQTMLANLHVPHRFVKTGQRVEKANQDWQRTWYRLMRLGRGGHNALDAQAHAICNNIKSAVTGFTPLEALETDERALKDAYNASRKRRTPYTAPEITVGDRCRHIIQKVVGKHARAFDYKTYRGKHWSEVFVCTKISAETEHQPKKFYVGGEYRTRDKLLLVPGTDAETEAQIARRLHV